MVGSGMQRGIAAGCGDLPGMGWLSPLGWGCLRGCHCKGGLSLYRGKICSWWGKQQRGASQPCGSAAPLTWRVPTLPTPRPKLPTRPGDGCLQGGQARLGLSQGIALTAGIPWQLRGGFFSKLSSLLSCLSPHSLLPLEHPPQAGRALPPNPTPIPLQPRHNLGIKHFSCRKTSKPPWSRTQTGLRLPSSFHP